ncbi:hypothetical protein, partial [Trichocoleus sp. DQ-U1]|uniref:hypothetical protein n=1 Tax=Trichocoleus sp. DQ-U1 TaxID=2933926 RepID=UPI0032983014
VRMMSEKAANGVRLLDAEGRSALMLERMDFQTALQIVARKHQTSVRRINEKIPLMKRREALSEEERKEKQERTDLIMNGSRSSQKKGFWQGIGDWFSGR